jgi:hypothetical protein
LSGDDVEGDADGEGDGLAGPSLGVDDDFSAADAERSESDEGRSESDEGTGVDSVLSGALPELPLRLSVL